jgi:TM2 domain-containing membrane protein YozV
MTDDGPSVQPIPQGDHTPAPLSPPQSGAPPHPLDAEWYVFIEGQTYGPYSGHLVAQYVGEGRITGATQVCRVGTQQWIRAVDDLNLAPLLRPGRPQGAQPAATAAAGATIVQVTNQMPAMMFDPATGEYGPKSPGLALLLSFLFAGVGQMYCGRIGKGILMMIGCIALWFVLLGWTVWIWSMIDAYHTAKAMNLRYLARLQHGYAA